MKTFQAAATLHPTLFIRVSRNDQISAQSFLPAEKNRNSPRSPHPAGIFSALIAGKVAKAPGMKKASPG